MTDAATLTALAACVAALAAVMGAIRSFMNGRQNTEMTIRLDGRMTETIDAIREQARLEIGAAVSAVRTEMMDPEHIKTRAADVVAAATQVTEIRAPRVPPVRPGIHGEG